MRINQLQIDDTDNKSQISLTGKLIADTPIDTISFYGFPNASIQIRRLTSEIRRFRIGGIFRSKRWLSGSFNSTLPAFDAALTHAHTLRPSTTQTEYKVSCVVRRSTVCSSAVTFSVPYRRHHRWTQSIAVCIACSPAQLICLPLSMRLYIRALVSRTH